METTFKILLGLHIAGGSIGLITGSLNLLRKKGDKKHKSAGKVFTVAMMLTGFSALCLSIIHPNYFLFIVGAFTIYLVGTGRRYIYLKMLGKEQKPAITDWTLTISMLLAGIVFIILGIIMLLSVKYFGTVLLVFGLLSLMFVRTDLLNYTGKPKEKNYWLLAHLQRMTGAFIAASTAFLVVNAQNFPIKLPSVLVWLLPTLILTPLIIKWSKKYGVK